VSAIAVTGFPARHGFFTRAGGVSGGEYASLNCSVSSADDPVLVAQNRALVAQAIGVERLLGLTQVHGVEVITVVRGDETGARADAMVTKLTGVGLGVITADCAPVLLVDAHAGVIGAAHAGWRSAVGGVLEATLAAMRALGARRIVAAIGPCIAQDSYEVGPELREAVERRHWGYFRPGEAGRFWFDLAGYCKIRLQEAGAERVITEGSDTFADERFWSHRRRTLRGDGLIGHQISVIAQ
jgi:YfiH family protein